MTIDTIVIHYTATFPDTDYTWERLEADQKARGFREGAYHWYIRRTPTATLVEGRREGTMGAGVRGHNGANILHVCWEGGLERATGPNKGVWNITKAQEEQLVRLIRDIQKRHPKAQRVIGHIDLAPSQCPGLPKGGVAKWWAEQQKTQVQQPTNWLVELIKRFLNRG
jgi:N-acetylmuramoyl-L-alanine amidase